MRSAALPAARRQGLWQDQALRSRRHEGRDCGARPNRMRDRVSLSSFCYLVVAVVVVVICTTEFSRPPHVLLRLLHHVHELNDFVYKLMQL